MNKEEMHAVIVEKYAVDDWLSTIMQRIKPRFPAATAWKQNSYTATIYLHSMQWNKEDAAFFSSLHEQNFIQNWLHIRENPLKESSHRKATLQDIGYQVREGKPLNTKQQLALFEERQELERKLQAALADAEEQRILAVQYQARLDRLIPESNALSEMLREELSIQVYSKGEWYAKDRETGQILAQSTDVVEVYRAVLRLRCQK